MYLSYTVRHHIINQKKTYHAWKWTAMWRETLGPTVNKWESKSPLPRTIFGCINCKVPLTILGKPDFDPSSVWRILILCYEEVQEEYLICIKYNDVILQKVWFSNQNSPNKEAGSSQPWYKYEPSCWRKWRGDGIKKNTQSCPWLIRSLIQKKTKHFAQFTVLFH